MLRLGVHENQQAEPSKQLAESNGWMAEIDSYSKSNELTIKMGKYNGYTVEIAQTFG